METRTQTAAGAAIARSLLSDSPPSERVAGQPWQTIATYMMMSSTGDVCAALLSYAATLSMTDRLAVGALVGGEILSTSQGDATGDNQRDDINGKSRSPGHDDLRDLWENEHDDVLFGLGYWRQYGAGVWSAIDENIVLKQIMRTIEGQKKRGARITSGILTSVSTLAKIDRFIPQDIWDASDNLLVCANGMLSINTKTLLPHSRDAYQTTGVSFDYDPEATCPTFEDALTRLPYSTVQFLQEFAGYCLTTDTSHEVAVWFLGPPGCGKSTIIEGIIEMLGDRAGLINLHKMAHTEFGMPDIAGKTLLYTTENGAGLFDKTAELNAIVSGEVVQVERKRRDSYEARSRAKFIAALNKLPRIRDAGDGIFRRIQIIRFSTLPQGARDAQYKQKIKAEVAGILNWALAGLDRLNARGAFDIPQEVRMESEKFQSGNDPERAFLEEMCDYDLFNQELKTQSNVLYAAYYTWCRENGHNPKSSSSIRDEWERLGLQNIKPKNKSTWVGAKLLSIR